MDVFGAMGTVAELKMFPDPKTGGFRGMGTCTYASADEAQTAIKALRDFDVDGRPMWCAEDTDKGDGAGGGGGGGRPKTGGGPQVAIPDPVQCFFAGVPGTTTEATLAAVFAEAGQVVGIKLAGSGMGVVTFAVPESARYAAKHLREREVDGQPMWVATHAETTGVQVKPAGCKVFFSNVPFDVTEDQLKDFFDEVGKINHFNLFMMDSGKSRGMGTCTYVAPAMAAAALRVLKDRNVGGRPIWVSEDTRNHDGAPMASGNFGPAKFQGGPVPAGVGIPTRFQKGGPYGKR